MDTPVTYESLFKRYQDDSAILRMEKYAYWSLPSIFVDPDMNSGKQKPVQRDYQSVGAMLTNTLASKVTGLLFPTNQSFFRLSAKPALAAALGVDSKDVVSSLATLENDAYRRIFLNASYNQLVHAHKLLIATGNTLLYRDSTKANLHAYSLRQYAVCRDGSGTVLDIILKERTAREMLPLNMQHLFKDREEHADIVLYTRVKRERGTVTDFYVVTQSVENHLLDTHEEYPEAVCPYIPVTWNLITGETYGRGLVEDYAGDFAKLSELSEALSLYEIEACRVLHMAKQGSATDIDSAAQAESGTWISGDPQSVAAYEAGDYNKILALTADLNAIFQRLAPAFMYGGNTRDAERVTAEEIRQQADEANVTLGGVYSSLAHSEHIPLAHILCAEVNPDFVAEVVRGGVHLDVMTGVAALGRSGDVNKLIQASQALSVILPVLTTNQQYDPLRITAKVLEAYGLNVAEITFTEEELKQKQQQASAAAPVGADVANVAGQINPGGVL
jgi:hypothetical protein